MMTSDDSPHLPQTQRSVAPELHPHDGFWKIISEDYKLMQSTVFTGFTRLFVYAMGHWANVP